MYLLIINAILTAIVAYLGFGAATNRTPGVGAFIAGLIAAFIFGIIALLLWAVFLHIGAKVMSGRGDFADSFKSAVYAQTPNLLLGWIPIIGIIFWLWSIGTAVPRRPRAPRALDTTKAVIAVVIAVVLFIIVIAVIAAILAAIGIAILGGIAGLSSLPGYVPPDF